MAVKKTKTQKQAAPNDFCAYIGPTVRGFVQQGTIFPDSKDKVLDRMVSVCKRYPEFSFFVIQGQDLADARKAIKKPGTLLYAKNSAMLSRMKEEKT